MSSDMPANENGQGPIWDFIDQLDLNHLSGPADDKQPSESLPAVYAEPKDDPLSRYLPHNHKSFWKMIKEAELTDQPEKMERAQRFFQQCPDGSCRQKFRQIAHNLESFIREDENYEQFGD